MNSLPQIREIRVEQIKIAVRANICYDLQDGTQIKVLEETTGKNLAIELWAYIYAMPKEHIFIDRSFPKTWIDAIKNRWFPRWALKKWPIQWEHIKVDQRIYGNICPHITFPDHRQDHVIFLAEPVKSVADWAKEHPMNIPGTSIKESSL